MSVGERSKVLSYTSVDLYHKELLVLHDVNIDILKGEFLYIIGRTGSGKSTFLQSIYGEIPIREGMAQVAGVELTKLRRRQLPSLRRRLGMIFQDFRLLDDRTVYENMRFVLRATGWKDKAAMDIAIQTSLEQVGLQYKSAKHPFQLSGGERQRVAIARALLNNPELIIADEPTGNLDPETSNDIMSLLQNLQKSHDAAILIATHDYRLLSEFPGRILRCEGETIHAY